MTARERERRRLMNSDLWIHRVQGCLSNRGSKCHRLTCWLNKNYKAGGLQCCMSWWYILTFWMYYYLSFIVYNNNKKKKKRSWTSYPVSKFQSHFACSFLHQLNNSFATFQQDNFCFTCRQRITSLNVSPELSLCRSNCCHLHAHAPSFSATLAPPQEEQRQ